MSISQIRNILLLSANPKKTSQLRLAEEMRDIKEGLRLSENRDQFSISSAEAIRPRDIRRAILTYKPHIIHFSGHGSEEEGLVFEDETGAVKFVDGSALAGLFELFANQVECVVLNACHSKYQASEIARHINYVVGMSQEIQDKAAIEFAVGFYDGLGAGEGYDFAYKLGCNAILMEGLIKLMELIGGHPYLLQQAFVNIKSQQINLEQLFTLAPTEEGIFSDYLRQQLWQLQHNPQLEVGYKKVVRANAPVRLDAEVAFKLHSLGLVKLSGNDCVPSCDLYRQYFSERLA